MFRALIVDDARAELEVLLFLIQKNNLPLKTVTAINGEEALDRLRQEEFDILVTDIRMPFMDGLTLAGEALTLLPLYQGRDQQRLSGFLLRQDRHLPGSGRISVKACQPLGFRFPDCQAHRTD